MVTVGLVVNVWLRDYFIVEVHSFGQNYRPYSVI